MKLSRVPLDLRPDELLCVVGPTASDKTSLAIDLCEELGGEVVGADSVQIYRHFDIGSGKPTLDERRGVPHHLIDVADATEPWDAARWASAADRAIDDIRRRGRVPVVCGGTYLWIRALVLGLAEAPPASAELRQRLAVEAEQLGREALHERLVRVDPALAARLSPNDFVRVQRALEVFELTGRRLSDLQREHQARPPRYAARLIGVRWSAEALEARIAQRVDRWLDAGWIDEVRGLVQAGLRDTRPMSSVGYRQVLDHIEDRLSREELSVSVTRVTKVFARRQRTWLRDEPVVWVDPE